MEIIRGKDGLRPQELIALYDSSGWGKASDYTPEWVSRSIENTTVIVQSRANGRLVEILRAFSDGVSTNHLSEILVHPAFRGQGIGTALMQAFLAGQPPTSLWVVGFEENIGFFERFGLKRRELLRAWSASSKDWKTALESLNPADAR